MGREDWEECREEMMVEDPEPIEKVSGSAELSDSDQEYRNVHKRLKAETKESHDALEQVECKEEEENTVSQEERHEQYLKRSKEIAERTLKKYNDKVGTCFDLVAPLNYAYIPATSTYHINFDAKLPGWNSPKCFFAVVDDDYNTSEFSALGFPVGETTKCPDCLPDLGVRHPLFGYEEDKTYKKKTYTYKVKTSSEKELHDEAYVSMCEEVAQGTLRKYNEENDTCFELVEALKHVYMFKSSHINFTAKLPEWDSPRLFFAEVDHHYNISACVMLEGQCRMYCSYCTPEFGVRHPLSAFSMAVDENFMPPYYCWDGSDSDPDWW